MAKKNADSVKEALKEAPSKKDNASIDTAVKKGDTVKVEYTGTLDDGTVFDSSSNHGEPLEFQVGAGQVIPGFENAMIGMKNGEEKVVKLKVSEAYGEYNPQLLRKVPRNQLPPQPEPKSGMVLMARLPNGMDVPVKITEVTSETVSIDMNHPLAGKALTFKIKLAGIS